MKWRFVDLKHFLEGEGLNGTFEDIYEQICDIAAKTLIGADDVFVDALNRKPKHRNNSFELFGFDILVDTDFKCWLLEVKCVSNIVQCWSFNESRC